jgi:hypothetical protein
MYLSTESTPCQGIIALGTRWRHHSTGIYEVVGLRGPDEIELERPYPQQGDVWRKWVRLDYFLQNFEAAI